MWMLFLLSFINFCLASNLLCLIITSPRLLSGDVLVFYYSYYYYSSTHFCPLDFSEMPWSNFMKPCRHIICHVKLWYFNRWYISGGFENDRSSII
jgi:hypothetical protein